MGNKQSQYKVDSHVESEENSERLYTMQNFSSQKQWRHLIVPKI